MFKLPQDVPIYFCVMPIDMRRSFDSLAEIVRSSLGYEPRSGHLFVFRNKAEDCVKILYWMGRGYAIWYGRLDRGKFPLPSATATSVEITETAFSSLLDGLSQQKIEKRKRYTKEPVSV